MREILFRGKRIDTGEWIEGYVYRVTETQNPPFLMVKDFHAISYEVYQDSVSQFTGLKDMNGKRIFEGDVVKADFSDSFNHDRKIILTVDMNRMLLMSHIEHARTVEVIGNIHDTPELLGEK